MCPWSTRRGRISTRWSPTDGRTMTLPHSLAERIVAMLANAPASRRELSRTLGCSRTSLQRCLAPLLDAGFIIAKAHHTARQGRPGELLSFDRARAWAVGIEANRVGARGVVLNRLGERIASARFDYEEYPGGRRAVKTCWRELRRNSEKLGLTWAPTVLAGVGLAQPVSELDESVHASLAETLGEGISLCVVDNCVRLAALDCHSRCGATRRSCSQPRRCGCARGGQAVRSGTCSQACAPCSR